MIIHVNTYQTRMGRSALHIFRKSLIKTDVYCHSQKQSDNVSDY